ncbi:MAG: helix-turn-helix domain-containing protein [Bacteroidales bacterium]|nr:helix-turn-helix domain-containing protein [Clostridium sp.]MCM1204489.1 helix-turn-helix domain-containing protein [Bacteroidales bacterium]
MKSTDELLRLLQNLDIEEFKKTDSFQDISISDYLKKLLTKSNIQPKELIIKLNMERSYLYQILNGRRRPTRNFLIRIAFLCRLSVDETQKLLTIGRRPILYPRNRFDAAVLYCLQHRLDEERLNQLLKDIGEKTLNG